jgi:hypothetical protein
MTGSLPIASARVTRGLRLSELRAARHCADSQRAKDILLRHTNQETGIGLLDGQCLSGAPPWPPPQDSRAGTDETPRLATGERKETHHSEVVNEPCLGL